jgi:hypothetical protein
MASADKVPDLSSNNDFPSFGKPAATSSKQAPSAWKKPTPPAPLVEPVGEDFDPYLHAFDDADLLETLYKTIIQHLIVCIAYPGFLALDFSDLESSFDPENSYLHQLIGSFTVDPFDSIAEDTDKWLEDGCPDESESERPFIWAGLTIELDYFRGILQRLLDADKVLMSIPSEQTSLSAKQSQTWRSLSSCTKSGLLDMV